MAKPTRDSITRGGGQTRERQPGPRKAGRVRSSLAVGALAASVAGVLAATALVAPAGATTKPALLAEAVAGMQQTNALEETRKTIPFKPGTKFTITCAFQNKADIRCNEHAGPEQCSKGKPWDLLSDVFPVIHGRVGKSLTLGLVVTSTYCNKA
jgi:hypothetical protein